MYKLYVQRKQIGPENRLYQDEVYLQPGIVADYDRYLVWYEHTVVTLEELADIAESYFRKPTPEGCKTWPSGYGYSEESICEMRSTIAKGRTWSARGEAMECSVSSSPSADQY